MAQLIYIFYCIKHALCANSRHGTHSPFVYKLADEVIYRTPLTLHTYGRKSIRLANEIARYFGVAYTQSTQDIGKGKALYIQDGMVPVDELARLQHQYRYIVVEGIYKEKDSRRRWRAMCQDPRFVVTVDLFFFGLLFCRHEQPKQNFRLRFPFWKY